MADQYAANLSLLLHCDGANAATTLLDACRVANVPVCKGTAALSTAQKQFGSASLKTGSANGNYVALGNVPGFTFGSGDFTVEAFVWAVSQGADGGAIIGRWDSSGAGTDWLVWRGANGEVNVSLNGTLVITGASGDLPTGAFAHVALTRQGTALQVWVGGVAKGSATFSGAINYTLGVPVALGQSNLSAAATWLEAYFDEVRITKGVARYTTAFTAPTAAFDPYPTDAYPSNTLLDLRFDGDNASTTITDEKAHAVTVNSGAKLSTAQAVLGGTSLLLNGSTDYLSLTNTSDMDLASGDYTLEVWLWINSITGQGTVLSKNNSTTSSWISLYRSSGNSLFTFVHSYNGAGSQAALNSLVYPTQQWVHLAVCRQGGTITMFCNGMPYATTPVTNPVISNAQPIRIGCDGSVASFFNGYIDGLRITKGVARYTGMFDPYALTSYPGATTGLLRGSRTRAAQGLVTPVVNRKAPLTSLGNSRLKDVTWGGTASVAGKVTINNVAAVRRVFLVDLKSMTVMRSAWSDASGNYSFVNIDGSRNYMVIGRDYQQVYNAVVQDSITPVDAAPAAYRPARRKLRFKAGGTGLSTNYPVLIRVGESTPSGVTTAQAVANADVICPVRYMPRTRDDVADIVFTDTSGNQLDFWMETVYGTAPDRIAYYWVKLPGDLDAGPVDIYVQYNRGLTQTKTSGGSSLFPTLFDDFLAYDSSKWAVLNVTTSAATFAPYGTPAVSCWSLQASGTEGYVQSVATWAAGLEALAAYTQFGYNSVAGVVQNQFGFVSGTGPLNTVASLDNVGDYTAGSRLAINGEATTNANGRFTPQVGTGVQQTVAQIGRLQLGRATDGSVALQVNNQPVMTRTGAGTGNANLAIYRGKNSQSSYISAIDWVALRKYIPSGPPAMLQFAEEFL